MKNNRQESRLIVEGKTINNTMRIMVISATAMPALATGNAAKNHNRLGDWGAQ